MAQRIALLHILNNVKGGFVCIIIHLEKIILEDLVVGEVIMILKQRHLGQLILAPSRRTNANEYTTLFFTTTLLGEKVLVVYAPCLFRNTYIWMNSGRSFWFFPTAVGREIIAGFRWSRRYGWYFRTIF